MSSKPGQAAEEEDARELKLGEDFVKAKCLMNAEVALILQRKYDQLQSFSDDAPNQISHVLSRNQLAEFEVCVIGNLCPETVEEAKALVPSIAKRGRMDDEKIEQMIADLATIKTFE